jgi:hypothetical protein
MTCGPGWRKIFQFTESMPLLMFVLTRRLLDFQLHPDTANTYSNNCFASFKDDMESLSKIRINQNWICCKGFLLIFESLFQFFGPNELYSFLLSVVFKPIFCKNSRTETETFPLRKLEQQNIECHGGEARSEGRGKVLCKGLRMRKRRCNLSRL